MNNAIILLITSDRHNPGLKAGVIMSEDRLVNLNFHPIISVSG